MKTKFITLLIGLVVSLEARENPFARYDNNENTNSEYVTHHENNPFGKYDSNQARKSKALEDNLTTIEDMQEADYIKRIQEQMNSKPVKNNQNTTSQPIQKQSAPKPAEKTYTKKEVDSLIQKTKQQTEQKTKEIVKKELSNSKKEPEQIVYVKPRADLSENTTTVVNNGVSTKTILPFLKIDITDDKLIINSEHKMFKKFAIDKENKLVFDYKAKVDFKTKREILNSKNFKNISVGNHQKGGYFRVAVELTNKPSKYGVDIFDGSITITLK